MFTGIIQSVGRIESVERSDAGAFLRVRAPEVAAGLAVGSSIAVNGCCLTVVERDSETFGADLSGETICRTSFGEMRPGQPVNLERPLAAGAELGGHFVQGHVDGIGRVTRLVPAGPIAQKMDQKRDWWLSVRVPEELARYVAEKGSLAVDGISLTVARFERGTADFAIIPFTHAQTNLVKVTIGDPVNLECDILAKYVERLLEARRDATPSRLTLEKLIEEGF
jgi:riboflavin synthase